MINRLYNAFLCLRQAIVIFHDHRAAGLIYQAIQCDALELSKEANRVYVKFLQAQECHKVSCDMRCDYYR